MQLNKPRWALGSTKRKQSHCVKVLLRAISKAESFYSVKNELSIIMSKGLSKNLSVQ